MPGLVPLLVLLLLLPAVVKAQFNYTTNNGAITITKYTGSASSVSIPAEINGFPVRKIGDYAFDRQLGIANITIPDSVTNIGSRAFQYCSRLTEITLPGGVTSIGSGAFQYCSRLTSVMIPNSVTSIGFYAFSDCTSLTNATIGNSVTSIEWGTFAYCAKLPSVTIPENVTSIAGDAFYRCTSLTAISVSTQNSFYSSFDGVLFDKNQTTLIQTPGAKSGSYTIPSSVTNVEYNAFSYCTNLTNVIIPNSVISIGMQAFRDCTMLRSVTIGNNVTSIGVWAFSYCFSLTTVILPNSLTSIGDSAFMQCSKLTNVIIGNKVSSIGEQAFRYTGLSSITIPESVNSIENYAFYGCANLKGLYFRGDAPGLGSLVFYDYSTVFYLPGTVGWGPTFGGRPTVLWNPQIQASNASFGVRTNKFGFTITGTSNLVIVVEVCTNLVNRAWSVVGTNTLTGGSSYFSDPQWTNHPARFYRLRSP